MENNSDLSLEWVTEEQIRTDILDTFDYNGETQKITYTTKEFSAVCPFSGLPDLATVVVTYIPSDKCIELKSLKLYFVSYRNVGMYQENITSRIYRDLYQLLTPKHLTIKTIYATRGGIDSECEVSSD